TDPLLAVVALSILPPQVLISRWLQRRLHAATRSSRRSQSDLTSAAKETYDGVETIKALGAEAAAAQRLQHGALQLEQDELKAHAMTGLINGNVWLMTSVGVALTWWLGGSRVLTGEMTLGTLVAFTGFIAFAYLPFRQFTTMVSTYRQGLVSLERINEILKLEPTVDSRAGAPPLPSGPGAVQFDNVSFAYDRHLVLRDVSLSIAPHQLVAVVGRSGSGKSSLLRLAARLYDPDAGTVRIDGENLRDVSLASVRQTVAVAPQRPMLFTGTIRDNVAWGDPQADRAAIEAALARAGALQFVERLPQGIDTRVGRAGQSLSGGETQRIAIARAVLAKARVLLLDEPTSALDAAMENVVVDTLRSLSETMTVLVVAHKAPTVRAADRVVVLDQGRL
ncbi:MAG: ABC transporter ATP-binding protein, partial [Planctomycetales bacterium]|nr:ABC transporter ATP-binding protein [Planctomycetales bacterium]